MKYFKHIVISALIAFVAISVAQAQKTFKASDVVEGKTIKTWAKDLDLQVFQQSKEFYTAGMSQGAFIQTFSSDFTAQTPESLKAVFGPYFEYIFEFHSRGLSDSQVVNEITGNETAALCTELSSWNANNPGQTDFFFRKRIKKFMEDLEKFLKGA